MYFLEQLINGICQGSIYALVAIGYTMIVGIIGLVSFCYGETVMLGAFVSYMAFTYLGDHILIAFLVSFLGTAVLGIAIHKICYEPFFESPRHISLTCTIGAGILIKSAIQIVTKSETKAIPQIFGSGYLSLGQIRIGYVQLAIISIVIVLSIGLSFFLNRTRTGIMLKAVSQDKKAAALLGVNVSSATLIGNFVGCGLGGVAGMLYSVYYGAFQATMGGAIGMKAFSSSVLGGLHDIAVSALGGLGIGVLENIGISLAGTGYRDLIAFIFLILVLIFMPSGLSMPTRRRKKK
ncbi:MAG: branched-chain amino acid ABC transporter permease [Eubacteriales bacterium]|nr:branched-chain amino acid ABC transporter permease [Eubacteriales bacterium]